MSQRESQLTMEIQEKQIDFDKGGWTFNNPSKEDDGDTEIQVRGNE